MTCSPVESCGEGAQVDEDRADPPTPDEPVDTDDGVSTDGEAAVRTGMEGCDDGETGIIRAFRLLDLSAGGCLCEDPDHFLESGRSYRASLQLNDKERSLDLLASVVRRDGGRAGISFAGIRERDRERIMRALFREYRRRRSTETRCGEAD